MRDGQALLLDANVLIALSVEDHEHHAAAKAWLGASRRFATTPSTQGTLCRYIMRVGTADHAIDLLELIAASDRHEFWPDDEPYGADVLCGLTGHRQVTDSYLAIAAQRRGTILATFDRGLAELYPAVVELI